MWTPELISHIESGVSMIVATRDAAFRPECARALGARVDPAGTITVFLPSAVAGRCLANAAENGRIAVAFSRICDHHTIQIKGAVLSVGEADPSERPRVDHYRRVLAKELALAGLPEHVVFRICHWPCHSVVFRPESRFDQTPGPGAGALVEEDVPAVFPVPRVESVLPGAPRSTPVPLHSIEYGCFQGLLPSLLATCDSRGEPNITYLSQVHSVDSGHVALSCQFFNKTKRNLLEIPFACLQLYHPLTFQAWQLRLRFVREEKEGPLFDSMSARIDVIASHTGMAGIFRLRSADVHEVLSVEHLDDFLLPDPVEPIPLPDGATLGELRGLQEISARIATAVDRDSLLSEGLRALDELLGLHHTMVVALEPGGRWMEVVGSHGYHGTCPAAGNHGNGDGATPSPQRIEPGAGVLGTAVSSRRIVRISGIGTGLNYGRAIRSRFEVVVPDHRLHDEIGLPGLCDAQAQIAIPMFVGCRLVGVLSAESRDPLGFDEWDEAFLQIVANHLGARLASLAAPPADPSSSALPAPGEGERTRHFVFYRDEETIFLDGEYLTRNVPARILWKILTTDRDTGRRRHANRELRLDRSLGLPRYRDNFESRLILLRRRLEERCPDVRLVPVQRGVFELETTSRLELEERTG